MFSSYNGARTAVPREPGAADDDPTLRLMRTVAVLGMIFGLAGVISLPFGLMSLHQGSFAGDFRVNLLDLPGESPSADVLWLYFSSVAGTGLALLLLLGSVAAIQFRPLARPMLMLWAIASLLVGGGGSYFYVRWLLPPWRDHMAQVRGVVDSLVNFAGWGIGTTLAIVMLILLTRPSVRSAFGGPDSTSVSHQ